MQEHGALQAFAQALKDHKTDEELRELVANGEIPLPPKEDSNIYDWRQHLGLMGEEHLKIWNQYLEKLPVLRSAQSSAAKAAETLLEEEVPTDLSPVPEDSETPEAEASVDLMKEPLKLPELAPESKKELAKILAKILRHQALTLEEKENLKTREQKLALAAMFEEFAEAYHNFALNGQSKDDAFKTLPEELQALVSPTSLELETEAFPNESKQALKVLADAYGSLNTPKRILYECFSAEGGEDIREHLNEQRQRREKSLSSAIQSNLNTYRQTTYPENAQAKAQRTRVHPQEPTQSEGTSAYDELYASKYQGQWPDAARVPTALLEEKLKEEWPDKDVSLQSHYDDKKFRHFTLRGENTIKTPWYKRDIKIPDIRVATIVLEDASDLPLPPKILQGKPSFPMALREWHGNPADIALMVKLELLAMRPDLIINKHQKVWPTVIIGDNFRNTNQELVIAAFAAHGIHAITEKEARKRQSLQVEASKSGLTLEARRGLTVEASRDLTVKTEKKTASPATEEGPPAVVRLKG